MAWILQCPLDRRQQLCTSDLRAGPLRPFTVGCWSVRWCICDCVLPGSRVHWHEPRGILSQCLRELVLQHTLCDQITPLCLGMRQRDAALRSHS
eukprot:12498738-Alexandrium_andersonii.AAC.1